MSAGSIAPVTPPPGMPAEDIRLLEIAQTLLARVWVHGRHEVATALRAADGRIYTGVHVEGSCRRSSICAEGVALGTARAGLEPGLTLAHRHRGVSSDQTRRPVPHHRALRCLSRVDQRLQPRHANLDYCRHGYHSRRRPGSAAPQDPPQVVGRLRSLQTP